MDRGELNGEETRSWKRRHCLKNSIDKKHIYSRASTDIRREPSRKKSQEWKERWIIRNGLLNMSDTMYVGTSIEWNSKVVKFDSERKLNKRGYAFHRVLWGIVYPWIVNLSVSISKQDMDDPVRKFSHQLVDVLFTTPTIPRNSPIQSFERALKRVLETRIKQGALTMVYSEPLHNDKKRMRYFHRSPL